MKQALVYSMAVVLLISGLSFIAHYHSPRADGNAQKTFTLNVPDFAVDNEWASTLKKIAAYYTAPEVGAGQSSGESAETARDSLELTDARLLGIVQTSKPRALLKLPDEDTPVTLKIGESWLSPWALDVIENDRVHWKNSETQEIQVQYLFN